MARRAASSRRRKTTLSIPDMSKVEGRILVAEGEYSVEVAEISEEEGDKAPYFKWTFEITGDKKFDGAKLYYNTSLAENSLWNLKGLLEALGVDIPDEAFELDPDEVAGKTMGVVIEHETYQGRKQAKIVDFYAEEDEEPAPRRGSGRKKNEDEPAPRRSGRTSSKEESEEEITQDMIDDMEQDELEDFIKEHKLRVDLSAQKTLRKMRAAVIDAADKKGLLGGE